MIGTNKRILIIDCQTTATHPSQGQLLEIAWCWLHDEESPHVVERHLVALKEGNSIPYRVREMTGITDEEMASAKAIDEILHKLQEQILEARDVCAVAHYSVFEKTFLESEWQEVFPETPFPLSFVCTQKISKFLYPRLTSYNLRAVSGFFGSTLHINNRADSHVEATIHLWRAICRDLKKRGVESLEDLKTALSVKPAKKEKVAPSKFEYRMSREKRLAFPDVPGVYKMYSKDGKILYVGKATSLRSRVNSYFRGGTAKDRRKQELMAQVWDIEVTPCRSPLESALIESDEIKKWRPRYNVALRESRRPIVYYDREFVSSSPTYDAVHRIGPFKNKERLEQLQEFFLYLQAGILGQPFWDELEPELIQSGWDEFVKRHGITEDSLTCVRLMLAIGFRLWRENQREQPASVSDTDIAVEDVSDTDIAVEDEGEGTELTALDVADKFERMFMGAAQNVYRARRIQRLINAKVKVKHQGHEHYLCFSDGQLVPEELWSGETINYDSIRMDAATYDRLSILLSGLEASGQDVLRDI